MPKCPNCALNLSSVAVHDLEAQPGDHPNWRLLGYACPTCETMLSVQIDPVAVQRKLVQELKRELRQE